MILTENQQKAIEIRDKNLLVSAAAGSGKTRVLVERIKQMVLSNECDIDKLLVVTFTNAAAQEMRSRIYETLSKELNRNDTTKTQEQIERLERQKILMSSASIMTIHSFCQTLLKRYFAKIDLDPKFRLADDQELNMIRQGVIEDLFEDKYKNNDKDFIEFTDKFGGDEKGDDKIHNMVIDLYKYSQCQPYPEKWLKSLIKPFEIDDNAKIEDTIWYEFAMKQIKSKLDSIYDECAINYDYAMAYDMYAEDISADMDILFDLKRASNDWNRLYNAILNVQFKNLKPIKNCLDDEAKELIQKNRDAYKKSIDKLYKSYFFATSEEMIADIKAMKPMVEVLINTTIDFSKAYAAEKHEKSIIDFNDMEHFALQILSDEQTVKTLRSKYRAVMVDEYQDINGVQDAILNAIANKKDANFFAVGDIKQSIYGFRLTDSSLFQAKYKEYSSPDNLSSEKIDLSQNFRSRSTVLESVNYIFDRLMNEEYFGIEYDDAAKLYCGFKYPTVSEMQIEGKILDTPTEFYLIKDEKSSAAKNNKTSQEVENSVETLQGIEREAQVIANRIKNMMNDNTQIYDVSQNKYRKLRFRDIVILLRSQENTASQVKNILEQNDIKAYSIGEESYFKALEIQVMLSLLSILDNARQDIPLAAVMLSPIGEFTSEELALMRVNVSRYADLFTVLTMTAVSSEAAQMINLPANLSDKAKNLLKKLNEWRDMSQVVSVSELITTIYRETGYYDYVGGLPEGVLRQANLRMLVDRAAAYENTALRGLARFLKFVNKIKELKTDLSIARTLGENEDVVRIMTIHKSKGLEFPVVFVAGLGKQFNLKDEKTDILLKNRKLGLGIQHIIKNEPVRFPTLSYQVVSQQNIDEQKAEEMRILYVAMTRAREKLILVGTTKMSDKNLIKLQKYKKVDKVPGFATLSANTFLEWILIALSKETKYIKTTILDNEAINMVEPSIDENIKEIRADMKKLARPHMVSTSCNIPSKMSVTELKRRVEYENEFVVNLLSDDGKEVIYKRPDFEQSKKVSGIEYGLLMHSVMQRVDLNGDLTASGIKKQIDEMVKQNIFTIEQAKIVRNTNAAKFFASDIGKRMINSNEIYRELPFSRLVDVSKFYPNVKDKIFIQGIIDVLFRSENGFILLDYKTDKFNSADVNAIEQMRNKYQLQMDLYSEAIEAVIKKPIAEKYLYMLSDNTFISM